MLRAAVAAAWLAAQPAGLPGVAAARPAVVVWRPAPEQVETAAFPAALSRCGLAQSALVSASHSASAPNADPGAVPDAAPADARDAPVAALGVVLAAALAAVRVRAPAPARPVSTERPLAVRRAARERLAPVVPKVVLRAVPAARRVARVAAQPEVVRLDAAVVLGLLRADEVAPAADAAVAPAQRAPVWLHPACARRAWFQTVPEVVEPAPAASFRRERTTTWRTTE